MYDTLYIILLMLLSLLSRRLSAFPVKWSRRGWYSSFTSLHASDVDHTQVETDYYMLCNDINYQEVVKKSKFLVQIRSVQSEEEGFHLLKKLSDTSANHNCWAMITSTDGKSLTKRSSDDGEPGGTAGKPILTALEAEKLVGVLAIVTRYFGGIKLGTGGLIRAYHGAVKNAITEAKGSNTDVLQQYVPMTALLVSAPNQFIGALYRIRSQFAQKLDEDSVQESDGDIVTISFVVISAQRKEIEQKIQDLCKGSASIRDVTSSSVL